MRIGSGCVVGRADQVVGFRALLLVSLVVLAALTNVGCGLVATSIASVQAKPADYLNREVTVAGQVTDSLKLPFLPGVYGINDGSGEMKVLTDVQPPATGERVRIQVRVESAATIGTQVLGLHLKELKRY